MSGYPYGGNPPQYPPPQNQIYPQIYNPANAPPPGQNHTPGQAQPYQFQPGFAYPYQPGQPAAMAYPGQPQPGMPGQPAYGMPSAPSAYPVGHGFPMVTPTATVSVDWVPSTVHQAYTLTDRAVVAGYEGHDGSPLWVIRARFEGDLIPGKLAIKHHGAYIPWGGKENGVQNFEVCCARPETIRWIESSNGAVPPKAVVAGNSAEGEPLYVGRARQDGSLTPGKVHPSHKCMYMSFAGNEVPHKTYEVLCTI